LIKEQEMHVCALGCNALLQIQSWSSCNKVIKQRLGKY